VVCDLYWNIVINIPDQICISSLIKNRQNDKLTTVGWKRTRKRRAFYLFHTRN